MSRPPESEPAPGGTEVCPEADAELGHFIRERRRSARLSLRRLSELAGVSNPYLSQIERGLRRPSAEILQAIAAALGLPPETLYVKAGFLDDGDLEADIRRSNALTEGQKQRLIDLYRSFVPGADDARVGGQGSEPGESAGRIRP